MHVRRYKPGEERAIWDVYYGSTRNVVATRYTADQVNRWAPDNYDDASWTARLQRSKPFVAVCDDQVVGFAELLENGQIDYFYCHHEHQRKGIGTALMQAIISDALKLGVNTLNANVSLTAVDFFRSHGFEIITETNKLVCGKPAPQFQMSMTIPTGS